MLSWSASGALDGFEVCVLEAAGTAWRCDAVAAEARSAALAPFAAGSYVVRLTGTGRAGLQSHAELAVTADATAPAPGAVRLGTLGALYWGASDHVRVSWAAASDGESGVASYGRG